MPKRAERDRDLLKKQALIESMSASGCSDLQISTALEITESLWKSKKDQFPELREAHERGRITYLGGALTKGERWVPDLDFIEKLASQGLVQKQIAAQCGISEAAFSERKKDFPEIDIRIQRGRSKTTIEVYELLMESAKKGAFVPQVFLAKTLGEWNDGSSKIQHEVNVQGVVHHTFVGVKQMDHPEFQKYLEEQKKAETLKIELVEQTADAEVIAET